MNQEQPKCPEFIDNPSYIIMWLPKGELEELRKYINDLRANIKFLEEIIVEWSEKGTG